MVAVALAALRVDHRHRRRDREARRGADRRGRARGHLDDAVAEPDAGIGHRLALGEPVAEQGHELRAAGELAVVERVGRLLLGQVEDRDVLAGELAAIGLGLGSMAPSRAPALPQTSREAASALSSWDTNRLSLGRVGPMSRKASRARSMSTSGAASTTLRIFGANHAVADRHLAQGFEHEPVAHRVGQHRHLADLRAPGQPAQHPFEGVARVVRALAVVAVGEHAAARRPV